MKYLNLDYLGSCINRILDDTLSPFVRKASVFTKGRGMDEARLAWLRGLEAQGVLVFLRDPYTAGDDEHLLEMKAYIGKASPIPGFLNDSTPADGSGKS